MDTSLSRLGFPSVAGFPCWSSVVFRPSIPAFFAFFAFSGTRKTDKREKPKRREGSRLAPHRRQHLQPELLRAPRVEQPQPVQGLPLVLKDIFIRFGHVGKCDSTNYNY